MKPQRISRFDEIVSPRAVRERTRLPAATVNTVLEAHRRALNDALRADVVVVSPLGALTAGDKSDPLAAYIDEANEESFVRAQDLPPETVAVVVPSDIPPFVFPDELPLFTAALQEGDFVSMEVSPDTSALPIPDSLLEQRDLWSDTKIVIGVADACDEVDPDDVLAIVDAYWQLAGEAEDAQVAVHWYWPRPAFERDFETWLVKNLEQLTQFGYDVDLHSRQYRLPSGRIIDLLCRFRNRREWLIIENKAYPATLATLSQLVSYIDEFEGVVARGEPVSGLVVSDGTHEDFRSAALATGKPINWLNFMDLGYSNERCAP